MRINLYVHFDSVTSHIMTRGINMLASDFDTKYLPNNAILYDTTNDIGRFDVRTNFKILRGKQEVLDYFTYCHNQGIRIANWIDFESVTMMHQLTPTEISEILYLFHANQTLRSAFFYKLQNNFAFLTLPNGLIKTYYRYPKHFNGRFKRVLKEQMQALLNENRTFFFAKKVTVASVPDAICQKVSTLFAKGLKIDVAQAFQEGTQWNIPLFVIEDELTLLTKNQTQSEQVGQIIYDVREAQWQVEL